MGRHRRSAAGRAATSRATGVTETHGSYTSGYDPQDSYDWNDRADGSDWNAADGSTIGMAPYLHPEGPAEFHPNRQAHTDRPIHTDSQVRANYAGQPNHEAPPKSEARLRAESRLKSDSRLKSEAYLFATEEDYAVVFPEAASASSRGDGSRPGRGRRRKRKSVTPVKTGLIGVSAAVAIGTVAVATGAMPGLENYKLGGGNNSDKVQAAGSPSNSAAEQGGTSGSAESRDSGSSTSRDANRAASPSAAPTKSATAPATKAPAKKPAATPTEEPTTTTPSAKPTPTPTQSADTPVTVSAEATAEAEVLKLVNEQRAIAGCSPVAANSSLTTLAENFSQQMATEDFFDHTDPSGATPWDRAEKLGITNLGGENIARGQADAAAVMDAWMNSPGHKANILNCDFKTLGVGVHFGTGGPWWTQDFGY
ncbi:CAP domain-containing protein [Streptomyces sp. W16]|uniref:CAP domain-containing protein n=1 Tax=Streptomyces sp. W16 TaxID=3076631 RepID=UPI00295B0F15|nr:CAP domain-containing protein [Streptomyces sp. W16]MDV9173086.1 CAP domain-containing protein [Streptomyces sp. W16]